MNCKLVLVIFFYFSAMCLKSQTGIGTTTPNASAKLDVYSTNKGFLPPRVTLTSATDATTIASPAEGLLVYNLGSSGLQSGYYFWNGANWATIATASSAGNGVTAMDMVKLYGEAYSTATGKISNTSGYSFTVPVSGRYLFDFSSTTWGGNSTTTFKVRQGTTDLGTDSQTSLNNNVHVEYNGKIEVNLQAGITYNVVLTTNANRDSGDYDRVYYKMVAGNLPVTGQSVDYAIASLSANQSISAVGNVSFNTIQGAGITLTNGGFNLLANKTYKLEGSVGGSSTGYIYYAWVDATNTIIGGSSIGSVMKAGSAFSDSPQDKAVAIYTPTSNTTVYLRVLTISGTSVAYPVAATPAFSSTWATIQQVGSSAFVNPWTLSGTNTYNTTGNVGIGTNTPTQALDVTGNVNVTGKINLTDPTGNVTTKVAGFVDAGTYVTLDNVRATVNTSGSRGLGLATVTGSFSAFINGTYTVYTGGTNGSGTSVSITTTSASSSVFGWNFQGQGDTSTYIVNDTTNRRIYRITLMIGGGYLSNLITIERFL
jgi:hypothetical protein